MPFTKLNNYSDGDRNLTSLMTSTDGQRRGYHAVSLTNWTGLGLPEVAAGSVLEVGGALLEATADLAISGTPSDTQYNYIIIDSTAFTASWSTVAPTWNDEKQGFYSGNNRYLNYKVYRSGSNYTKYSLIGNSLAGVTSGDLIQATTGNITTLNSTTVNATTGNITTVNATTIDLNGGQIVDSVRRASFSWFFVDAATTLGSVWTALSPYLPNDIICHCHAYRNTSNIQYGLILKISSSSSIYIYIGAGDNSGTYVTYGGVKIGESGSATATSEETTVAL